MCKLIYKIAILKNKTQTHQFAPLILNGQSLIALKFVKFAHNLTQRGNLIRY